MPRVGVTAESRFARLRGRWEERAARYGTDDAGVLYQGLSGRLNRHIHAFHVAAVRRLLAASPPGARVLDVGCGFGRIGRIVRAERPDMELVGCDFTLDFCRLYRKGTGARVLCCDIARLPLRDASFDALIAVTALMYLPAGAREKATAELLALLRPGGVALFVEPSEELLRVIALVRPAAARATTGGTGLTLNAFRRLSRGGVELSHGGMPAFTLLLPLLVTFERLPRLQNALLAAVERVDRVLGTAWRFSLQRWILVRRPQPA
ncbi:MAG: hypothetical protein AUK49_02325 [Betaproteobacteria bacterium CG2_30_68_42]|nr:MAG: hypothetical protein AUK49_02325 [Betaproteobacteria bacterium CG2_30_68_42]PJA57137.1 MAG: hypothetical protein CO164_09510 [Rhodocyclales bacterium CG_4_9_14_3_um_filter_68_10]